MMFVNLKQKLENLGRVFVTQLRFFFERNTTMVPMEMGINCS